MMNVNVDSIMNDVKSFSHCLEKRDGSGMAFRLMVVTSGDGVMLVQPTKNSKQQAAAQQILWVRN